MKDSQLFGAAVVDEHHADHVAPIVQTVSIITRTIDPDYERLELRSRDVSRRRMIRGIASTGRAVDGVSLSSIGCIARLPLVLLYEHGTHKTKRVVDLHEQKIGLITLVEKRPAWIAVEAAIDSSRAGDRVWHLLETGEVKALSVYPINMRMRGCVDGSMYAEAWELREVSVGRSGKNADCFCRIIGNYDRDFYDFSDQ